MASRRGLGQALQKSSDLIQSIIEMKLRSQIEEDSQKRQAGYNAAQARLTAGLTSDRNLFEEFVRNPAAAQRLQANGMRRVGNVDVGQFVPTMSERVTPYFKDVESASDEEHLPTEEAIRARAKADGLPQDQLDAILAAHKARVDWFTNIRQRAAAGLPRYDPELGANVADREGLGRVQLDPTPTQRGQNKLQEDLAGVFSDAYTRAKAGAFNLEDSLTRGNRAASAGAIANAQASGSVQGEWNAKSLMLPKMVEVTRALEQAKQSGDAAGGARATQNALMLAKQMVDLSNRLNTTEGGWGTIKQDLGQRAGKLLHRDPDRRELDSLSEGYAPIFARLIGHTGVLTQQDVDSVRQIMPRAGLSKEENARINIVFMQTLQGAQQINALLGDIDPSLPKEAQSLEMRRRLDLARQYAVTGKLELDVK